MTGLSNRPDFARRSVEALRRFRRTRQACAIIYLDIDGFKQVNDTLGHKFGDELLKVIGDRIRTSIREVDSAARLGGDEFAVILEAATGQEDAQRIAERVRQTLAHSYQLGDHTVHVSASLGLAMITAELPDDVDVAAETALHHADQAMYKAKRNGGNQTVISTPQARREWSSELGPPPEAVYVRLWPLRQLRGSAPAGINVELTWPEPHHAPTLSTIQSRDLDRRIITTVLDQNQAAPASHELVCLPIHEATLHDSTFPQWLAQTTTARQCDPTSLVFKLDSLTRFKVNPTISGTITQLAEIGCSFQVTEFGAGYADIYTVHATPVRSLEIAPLLSTAASQGDFIHAIVSFGHDLNLKIVVGNLETAHQVNRMRDAGCDLGWGEAMQAHLADTALTIAPIP